MPLSTLREYPRIGGVIGYGPTRGSGIWTLQERYALNDDFYDDVSLLLHMHGSNGSTTFLDSSRFGHTVTANGDAQISTAQSKFGGASAAFDGNGDFLSVASNAAFGMGTGDFTLECWFRADNVTGLRAIVSLRTDGNPGMSGNNLAIFGSTIAFSDGVIWRYGNTVIATGQWYHAAVTRAQGTLRLWLNGANDGVFSSVTENFGSDRPCTVGLLRGDSSGNAFNGYIDDLRITKGRARYESAFTPRQRAFIP
jgi:hypothetical protein